MSDTNLNDSLTNDPEDIPVHIVNFSRWTYFLILSLSLITQIFWGTTLLLVILLPSLFLGRKWSLIGRLGKLLLRSKEKPLHFESRRIIFFNNIILTSLLFFAQIAFFSGHNLAGWILTLLVIIANGAALAGFCIGCVFYFRFKLYKYKFFGESY